MTWLGELLDGTLNVLLTEFGKSPQAAIPKLTQVFGSLEKLVAKIHTHHIFLFVQSLQKSLRLWLVENIPLMDSMVFGDIRSTNKILQQFWNTLSSKVVQSYHAQNSVLDGGTSMFFEIGMSCRHVQIVNTSISTWDKTFGCRAALEFPESLKAVLQRVKNKGPIKLPMSWKNIALPKTLSKSKQPPVVWQSFDESSQESLEEPLHLRRLSRGPKSTAPVRLLMNVTGQDVCDNSSPLARVSNLNAASRPMTAPNLNVPPESPRPPVNPNFLTDRPPRTPLTEHQREKRMETSVVPIMYSGLKGKSASAYNNDDGFDTITQNADLFKTPNAVTSGNTIKNFCLT